MYDVLEGVRVVEVSAWMFAPSCGAILADWGADVLKIEMVEGGDPYRGYFATGTVAPAIELANHGKRSLAVDLRTSEGRGVLSKVLRDADVFVTSLLTESRKRLRIDLDDIRADNPKIIYARATGQGTRGPDAEVGGFDLASAWARSGIANYLTLPSAAQPVHQPGGTGDCVGGISLAGAVAAALYKRERKGVPSEIDTSLLHAGLWMFAVVLNMEANRGVGGVDMTRGSRTAVPNPLVNSYRTKDDRWIWLVVLQPDPHWRSFCEHIGRPELAADERFATFEARAGNRGECIRELDEAFASATLDEWRERLATFSGVWSVCQTVPEVLSDPQVIANGYLSSIDGHGVEARSVTPPVQFDRAPLGPVAAAPAHGQQTEEVLLEHGYSWDDIAALKDLGAIL
ncbi:CaiB/BaiF CoA transferase family protein [Nocardia pseudovaccinii]|uniref:CaiB/BaiF CoA transferase family protein n=1 Tax=Nocardia pseudovaccinii TaxID=189540 RepID=UPI0007A3E2FF|nr:CoA transferase [Nocardia pseudovaccinii]